MIIIRPLFELRYYVRIVITPAEFEFFLQRRVKCKLYYMTDELLKLFGVVQYLVLKIFVEAVKVQ